MTQILAAVLMVCGGIVALIALGRLTIRLVPWVTRTPPKLLKLKLQPTLVWEIVAAVLGYMLFRMGTILGALS